MGQCINILEKMNYSITLGSLRLKLLSLNRVEARPDWFVPDHLHTSFELHIIPEGRGIVTIEEQRFAVRGGELFITGPMVRHSQQTDPACPMTEYCLECEICVDEPAKDYTFDEGVFIREVLSRTFTHPFSDVYGVARTFERLFAEAENRENSLLLIMRSLIEQIVLDVVKTVCMEEKIPYGSAGADSSRDYQRIQSLMRLIHSGYKHGITVQSASQLLYLSSKQIDRIMKKTFHQTFHEYLLTYRMHIAEKLLMNTTVPIEEVAYEAGFSSRYYMYQTFKRRGKPAPGKYRQS